MAGIILCFIPLIVAFIIFAASFKMKPLQLLLAVLYGLVAVLPISLIQYFVPAIPGLPISPVVKALLKSLLLYGFVEEAVKTVALFPLPHKNENQQGFLLLAFTAGLSLGCFESVVYYFDHLQIANSRGATLLYGQIAVRIFTSDVIHMMCTGLCGLFLYSCRNKPCRISCLVAAVLLHGIYDFFAGFSGSLRWFSVAVVLMSIAECRIKYSSLKSDENATN